MAGSHNPDDIDTFLLRIPKPLKDLLRLYADGRRKSLNRAIWELCETHPSITAFYERIRIAEGDYKRDLAD